MIFDDYLRAFPQWFAGTIERTELDEDALPAALLSLAKAQMRVRHDADDELISDLLRRAIGQVEAGAGLAINPSTWVINSLPWPGEWRAWWVGFWSLPLPTMWLPVAPVNTVLIELDGADVSSEWEIRNQTDTTGLRRTALSHKAGFINTTPAVVTMEAGYVPEGSSDPKTVKLPPLVRDAIMQIAATKYQTRESANIGHVQEAPDFDSAVLGPLWQPRA